MPRGATRLHALRRHDARGFRLGHVPGAWPRRAWAGGAHRLHHRRRRHGGGAGGARADLESGPGEAGECGGASRRGRRDGREISIRVIEIRTAILDVWRRDYAAYDDVDGETGPPTHRTRGSRTVRGSLSSTSTSHV